MKKLLNTLYIVNPNSYLALDGETVVVKRDDDKIGQFPLHNLQGIVTFGYTGASPALMGACAKMNIALTFMTPNGRFLARVIGEEYGNVVLRKTQFLVSEDIIGSFNIAKNFIFGKLYNSRNIINRTLRDHAFKVDVNMLKTALEQIKNAIISIDECRSLDELRGIEGAAAQIYFGAFDELIINQKADFRFTTRSKRPPLDAINAILSFIYALLAHDCTSALEGVGLDPYVGFMHQDRPGRASLAMDLMEELRAPFADRLALTLVNRNEITAKDFDFQESGAVYLNDEGRKKVLNAWQTKKKTEITHPFLLEKMEYGLVPHIQSMLLARFLRGDIDAYPPFLWK